MTTAVQHDPAAEARMLLSDAYKDLVAASKVAVGDDGKTLLTAAAAVDLAVELLTPPADVGMALGSCREALELTRKTRSYAPGGNIAKALDPGRAKLEAALKLLG